MKNAAGDNRTGATGRLRVLFLSTTRFGSPPDGTLKKKWQGLGRFFDATVIGFLEHGAVRYDRIEGGPRLILLPSRPPRPVRYVLHFLVCFACTVCACLTRSYRVIVAQSPYEAVAPALALFPFRLMQRRPRLVVEIHNDWKDGIMHYHPSRFAPFEKAVRNALGAFSLASADAYRAISEYSRRLLPENEKPVFVFPTYTDLENFRQPGEQVVADVRRQYGTGYFFYAGMLIFLKGVNHLIDAFALLAEQCPQARLIIAGKGPDEDAFRQQAARAGLADRIVFTGHVEQRVLAACVKNALCFVLPSLTEGLGRVAIEAHLLERPVIATRVGGVPEIVTHGKTGLLVDPGDPDALRRAMLELYTDPQRADRMGRTGRERVERKFTYEHYFETYYEMVREAAG